MKHKKLFRNLTALFCVAVFGTAAITGCNGEPACEHVYTWTINKGDESTCTVAGKRTGVCQLCGDIVEEEIPLDPAAHDYSGDWTITKPTESETGTAVKVCANNPEHVLSVTLPVVTAFGKGYDFKEFIKAPTTVEGGVMHLKLYNEHGVIDFNVDLAKRTLNTVEDAVILASSSGANVRTSEGYFQETLDGLKNNFSVYFGDDYTNIKDIGGSFEYWYSYDEEGKVFAMYKSGNAEASVVKDPEQKNMLGFHYQSGSETSSFYGAEQGLMQLYETAQTALEHDTCVNFLPSLTKINKFEDAVQVHFSYSLYENPYFCRYDVTFETFNDGTLKSLEVYTDIIRSYMYATDLKGNAIFYKEGDSYTDRYNITHKQHKGDVIFGFEYPYDSNTSSNLYEYDKDGNYVFEQVDDNGDVIYITDDGAGNTVYKKVTGGHTVTDPTTGAVIEYITEYETLDYVPNLHDVYLTDAYGMEILDADGNKIKKIMAQGGYPVNTYYSDDHKEVVHRYVVFNQTMKEEGEEVIKNPYDSNSLYVQSFEVLSGTPLGGAAIAFTDNKATLPTNTLINLTIGNILPETAGLESDPVESIYVIDPLGNKIPLKDSFTNGSNYSIYAYYNTSEKKVMINSKYAGEVELVFATKAGKCEQHVTINFVKSAPTSLAAQALVYMVNDGDVSYILQTVSELNSVSVVTGQTLQINATATGEEAGYVSTDIMPTATPNSNGEITFEMAEKDNYGMWNLVANTAGEYIVKLSYYDGNSASSAVYATFKLIVTQKLAPAEMLTGNTFAGRVSIPDGVSANPSQKTLTATFSTDGELTISVSGNTSVYSYHIDEKGSLVTEYKSGVAPTQKAYDFSFSINEAGDLVVEHSSGMGNEREERVLALQPAA